MAICKKNLYAITGARVEGQKKHKRERMVRVHIGLEFLRRTESNLRHSLSDSSFRRV
jgi:hypothetical protein